ncbi:DNA cytosine methyltransferase [Empedobacter falsenii]|uniref:class I SAM-dependent methyltransferase n=1 Tax=Empedobacter falsenii TaxID=343874 RepID=UPI003A801C4E
MIKVLNLYACLGGNRLLWEDCQVTAVELDPELARLYQERFPNDKVIIADAHQYLLEYYQEFDFIWSSPPCPSHSRARFWGFGANGKKPIYPDMTLYQEIIFLQTHFKGKWVIENVIPYYKPLIKAEERGRHLFWCNFKIPKDLNSRIKNFGDSKNGKTESLDSWSKFHDYDFTKYKGEQLVLKIARNLVDYETGKTIFNTAREIANNSVINQLQIF